MALRTLDDLPLPTLRGQRVLVRVDFNVPLAGGEVADDSRLREALPTLQELIAAGARLVLASHCGRPKGEPDPALSLRPVAARLEKLLGRPVRFAPDCIGEAAAAVTSSLGDGEVSMLENLRFHRGEKADDPAFAAALAAHAEAYVNDAFGTAHRAHASVVGVPRLLERKAAGRLLVREVEALGRLLGEVERPFAGILGGAKISGKIDTLTNLLPRLDVLLLGGGMANTFLAARGLEMGRSLVEEDRLETARQILTAAEAANTRVILPVDLVVTDDLEHASGAETADVAAVPAGRMAVDVGPRTRERFAAEIARARTLFWNGPLGVFETPPFDAGTTAVAESLGRCAGFTVVGGGETVAAVKRAGVASRLSHVSTGGGASLELLAGKILPGVAAVERA